MFELKLENINKNIVDINDNVKYQILEISGLNPPSATIYTSKSPNRKGVKKNGSTLNERTVVIQIKILGDVEENRNALYNWIESESYSKIYYRNGLKNVYCEGTVQDCEIGLFTSNEIINLVILCEDPYFKDLQEIVTEISMILAEFTFPFAIDEDGIPFSTVREDNETSIFNSGTETGILFKIVCSGDITNLLIYDGNDTSRQFKLNTTLLTNWVVEIDTAHSPKTLKAYKPDGTTENLLKYVNNNPTWFLLKNGNNVFGYSADSGEDEVHMTISFTNKYLGV